MAAGAVPRRPLWAAARVGVRVPSSRQMWAAGRLDDEGRALLHADCPHVEDCPVEAAETAASQRWEVWLGVAVALLSWVPVIITLLVAPHARWEGDAPDDNGDLNSPILPGFVTIALVCTIATPVLLAREAERRAATRALAAAGPTCDPWAAAMSSGHVRRRRRFAWVRVLLAGSERRTRLRAGVFAVAGGATWVLTGSWLLGLCAAGWSAAVVRSRRAPSEDRGLLQ